MTDTINDSQIMSLIDQHIETCNQWREAGGLKALKELKKAILAQNEELKLSNRIKSAQTAIARLFPLNKYFTSFEVGEVIAQIDSILIDNGFKEFDRSSLILGKNQLFNIGCGHGLVFNTYLMESGRYELNVYLS